MNKTRLRMVLWSLALGMMLSGCASSSLKSSWVDSQHRFSSYKKVMVMGIAKEETTRRTFEDQCVQLWAQSGVTGIASYQAFPGPAKPDPAVVNQYLAKQSIGALLIVQMKSKDTVAAQSQASATSPTFRSGGWSGYYDSSSMVVNQPATAKEYQVVTVESHLFDAATQKNVGIVVTESMILEGMTQQLKELARVITRALLET